MNTRKRNNSIRCKTNLQNRMFTNTLNSRQENYRSWIERTLIKFTISFVLFTSVIFMKHINTVPTNYAINLLKYKISEKLDIVEVYNDAKNIVTAVLEKGEQTLEAINLRTNYSSEFINPMEGEITTFFQEKTEGSNTESRGITIKGRVGANIIATQEGVVLEIGQKDFNGYYIIIKHRGELLSVYKNLESSLVEKSQKIIPGEVIGTSSGELQFEIWSNKEPVDPLYFINLESKSI